MKKFFAAIIALVVLATVTAFAEPITNFSVSKYVGNANTKKFHYVDCSMVDKMNPANKVFMSSREEAINAGYVPCKRCKP